MLQLRRFVRQSANTTLAVMLAGLGISIFFDTRIGHFIVAGCDFWFMLVPCQCAAVNTNTFLWTLRQMLFFTFGIITLVQVW